MHFSMSLTSNKLFLHLFWNRKMRDFTLASMRLLPLHKGRVMCVCWGGKEYGCNPKSITDALLEQTESRTHFEIWYAFQEIEKFVVADEIHKVLIGSLQYYQLLLTSQFIISNTRFGGGMFWPMAKKKGQYYIQTGHGSSGVKRVEFDTKSLSADYLKAAMEDTSRIDLMLSNSKRRLETIRSGYRYEGEVLEEGFPRNDAFIKPKNSAGHKKYLVYAPTFRNNNRLDVYGFDVDKVILALETRFGGEWYIKISSHPNMRSFYQDLYDFSHPRLIDIGKDDLQSHLLSSDALLTDYSSAEMDFSLSKKPVFQLCRDCNEYDRGFYFHPTTLPFPYAENDEELIRNILNFDEEKYKYELETFHRDVIQFTETGHASKAVVEWMLNRL